MTDTMELSLGLMAFYAAVVEAVGALWLRFGRAPREPEIMRCERCGLPTTDPLYHRRRCLGAPKSQRVGSNQRRRW